MEHPIFMKLLMWEESNIQHAWLGFLPEQSERLEMPALYWQTKFISISVSHIVQIVISE